MEPVLIAVAVAWACVGVSAATVSFRLRKRLAAEIRRNEALAIVKRDAEVQRDRAASAARAEADRELKRRTDELSDKLRKRLGDENRTMFAQAFVGQHYAQLEAGVVAAAAARFDRMSQEFLGTVGDEAEGLTRQLKVELADKVWDAFQLYKERHDDTPVVFPDNTKIAYTKGNRTVIVIEQKPQVRTVGCTGRLVSTQAVASQSKSHTAVYDPRAEQHVYAYRYSLAFPYVYFVVVFDNGKHQFHEVYFRNKPLTSAREHLHLAPIPNVFRRKEDKIPTVCMGRGLGEIANEPVCRQAEYIVSAFWQRHFNADLGSGGFEKLDPRIKNFAEWQKNSEENPLFILDVQWEKGKTAKGVVEELLDMRNRNKADDPIDADIRKALDNGVKKVAATVKEAADAAKTASGKSARFEQGVKQNLEQVVLDHTKATFEQCLKQKD